MGSPGFATPSLSALVEEHEISAVVTQPDRPAGRGQSLRESAVKKLASTLYLPTLQPRNLREPDLLSELKNLEPELVVVAAYGRILPEPILALPKYGCINVHASLLPRWRGAAPVQAAILEGDEATGVTIMKMDPGLDTGPLLRQATVAIENDDTGGTLEKKLAEFGARLLVETIPGYISGDIQPAPQDDALATYAPMLRKKDGQIDTSLSAERLARQVRAFEPWPTSYFFWNGLRIVIRSAGAHPHSFGQPGDVSMLDSRPAIATSEGALALTRIQPAGKRTMDASDFINGAPDFIGTHIDS